MFKNLIFIFWASCLTAFSSVAQKLNDKNAKKIIESCVEAHGGKNYQNLNVSLNFRQYKINLKNKGSMFEYERSTQDSLNNTITDILNNNGFRREVNGKKQTLTNIEDDKFKEATNAVCYFLLLPFKLLDASVNSEFVGTIIIDNQEYDKVKVFFNKEGGGTDYNDVYCYWINQKTHTLDYLAYTTGGARFRKATKREKVGGIIFQDYENYEILNTKTSSINYDAAYLAGKFKLLSKIEQTNYKAH